MTPERATTTTPDRVRIVDVELGCQACGAGMLVPLALVPWWAEQHYRPRMTGAVVMMLGDPTGALWWWDRPDEPDSR